MNKEYNKKVVKKTLILLSLVAVIITIYQIMDIYAAFHSESLGTLNSDIAKWEIVINETDIVTGTIEEFQLNKLNVDNSNATNGKLAPGLEGYFEIVIEPRDTDVSVRYDITIDQSEMIETDIRLISVEETEGGVTIVRTEEDIYTGIIPLTSIGNNYTNKIKLVFKWELEGTGTEGDIEVEEGTIPMLNVPISIKVTQYLGEEIIAYTEPEITP